MLLLGFFACSRQPESGPSAEGAAGRPALALDQARLFTVEQGPYFKIVRIKEPWRLDGPGLTYLLVERGRKRPEGFAGARVVEVPLRRLATTSTTELSLLVSLGQEHTWVGHTELDFVSSPSLRRRIDRGEVTELGVGAALNLEKLLALAPEAVFADFLSKSELDRLARVEAAGIPVILVPSFLEATPLGRAEWLKFMALFFDQEPSAAELFRTLAGDYEGLRARVAASVDPTARPTVLTGGPFQDVWHVPGGRSFAAQLLADAGARYLWADDPATGALPLALEAVYARGREADFWLYPSHFQSLTEIVRADNRLADLKALRAGRVVTNDRRSNGLGGNDFWESGTARPDLVLADLVALFHPTLLPDHQPVYHRILAAE
jgi:iron complex transport system substrate-binding protein